jgi:hypothetical protein
VAGAGRALFAALDASVQRKLQELFAPAFRQHAPESPQTVSAAELLDALNGKGTQLLVLQACDGRAALAHRLLAAIPHVVSLGARTPATACAPWAHAFYAALARDKQALDESMRAARRALDVQLCWIPWHWTNTRAELRLDQDVEERHRYREFLTGPATAMRDPFTTPGVGSTYVPLRVGKRAGTQQRTRESTQHKAGPAATDFARLRRGLAALRDRVVPATDFERLDPTMHAWHSEDQTSPSGGLGELPLGDLVAGQLLAHPGRGRLRQDDPAAMARALRGGKGHRSW